MHEKEASSEDEFAAFAARQGRLAFRVAYALLRNVQDAEDVVQEIFMKLYRSRSWRGVRDEKAYVARCAWRQAATRQGARPREAEIAGEIPSQRASPEQEAMDASGVARIHRMIDSLPEELRQPLALSAVEELNSREIAGVMGIREGTVRTRLMRARQLLKDKMAREEVWRGR